MHKTIYSVHANALSLHQPQSMRQISKQLQEMAVQLKFKLMNLCSGRSNRSKNVYQLPESSFISISRAPSKKHHETSVSITIAWLVEDTSKLATMEARARISIFRGDVDQSRIHGDSTSEVYLSASYWMLWFILDEGQLQIY